MISSAQAACGSATSRMSPRSRASQRCGDGTDRRWHDYVEHSRAHSGAPVFRAHEGARVAKRKFALVEVFLWRIDQFGVFFGLVALRETEEHAEAANTGLAYIGKNVEQHFFETVSREGRDFGSRQRPGRFTFGVGRFAVAGNHEQMAAGAKKRSNILRRLGTKRAAIAVS